MAEEVDAASWPEPKVSSPNFQPPPQVIHMMMVTQYLDVLKEFAASGKATMVVPHGPSAVSDIESQVNACTIPWTPNPPCA